MVDQAVSAGERYHALLDAASNNEALAEWEAQLSSIYRAAGRADACSRAAERAVERAERLGETPVLARALANLFGPPARVGPVPGVRQRAERAIDLGERFDLEEVCIYTLNSYGTALDCLGRTGGDAPA